MFGIFGWWLCGGKQMGRDMIEKRLDMIEKRLNITDLL